MLACARGWHSTAGTVPVLALRRAYHGHMAASKPEQVDPVDEELAELLRDPDVRMRLEEFERRRGEHQLGKGVSHNEARRIVGLPPLPANDPRL